MGQSVPPPPARPVACPACGCPDLPAFTTRRGPRGISRVRRCKKCGRRIRTIEMVVSYNDAPRARRPAADLAADPAA